MSPEAVSPLRRRMISGRTPVIRLDKLLAWNWKAARPAMATAA
jgi:hypothetical protein